MIPVEQLIREVLSEVYTDEGVEIWLRSRNLMLGGQRPVELMETPEGAEEVLAVAHSLAHGNF